MVSVVSATDSLPSGDTQSTKIRVIFLAFDETNTQISCFH